MRVRGRAGLNVRPGYPFFLLRKYRRYALTIDDKPLILLIAKLTQILIKKHFFFRFKFYYMLYTYIRTNFFYRSTRTMIVLVLLKQSFQSEIIRCFNHFSSIFYLKLSKWDDEVYRGAPLKIYDDRYVQTISLAIYSNLIFLFFLHPALRKSHKKCSDHRKL